jgi:hypothetical protein
MAKMDRLLVAVVVVLAFVVCLFPARNSDFWLHLATGRDIVGGHAGPSTEPYSYTDDGSWVNHSWLYGVLLYGGYQLLGGPALIVVKGLLMAALAVLMLRTRRPGLSLWLPAVCTALAVLAMSPRFLLQPPVVSFLFLGVTFFLLTRRERDEEPAEKRRRGTPPSGWLGTPADRHLWLLPPLFAAWVNLDAWFFVGPLAVALYLAGEVVQEWRAHAGGAPPRPGGWKPLAAVLGAGLLACLLNPHHVHAFRLPAEIGATDVIAKVQADEQFGRLVQSPFQGDYFRRETYTVAGLAYFPLVVLGLVSFFLSSSALRWGRALVWLGFLALSAYHARAIPFFAVVAGPIAALNLQEYSARRFGTEPATSGWWKEWSLLGRGASVFLGLVLVFLAWPGWLHGFPNEFRRVGLTVEPDPSLVRTAGLLRQWRQEGKLKEGGRGLNLMPEVSNTLAWLCPPDAREEGFFDYRLDLYPPAVAEEYVRVRQAFNPRKLRERDPAGRAADIDLSAAEWKKTFRDRGITHVIVHDPDPKRIEPAVSVMLANPARWVPLHIDGHTAVFGVIDPPLERRPNELIDNLRARGLKGLPMPATARPDPSLFGGLRYDPAELAFGPRAEAVPPGKPRRPEAIPWWKTYTHGPGPRSLAADDALMHLAYFEDTAYEWHYERVMVPYAAALAASLVGRGGLCGDGLVPRLALCYRLKGKLELEMKLEVEGPLLAVEGPAAPPLLAVRSARRGLLKNPDDAAAQAWLGQAYRFLAWQTGERRLSASLPLLARVREAQMAAAFRNALTLQPGLELAHMGLVELYSRLNYRDLVLKHLGLQLEATRAFGPRVNESPKDFDDRVKDMEREHKALEKTINDDLNKYAVKTSSMRVFDKARVAMSMGLAEKALDVLLGSDALEFGADGARLQLDLLLTMGRLEDLRLMIAPDDPQLREEMAVSLRKLGGVMYEIYRVLLAAAEGDYAEADEFLAEAARRAGDDPELMKRFRQSAAATSSAARVALGTNPALSDKVPGPDLPLHTLAALAFAQALVSQLPQPAPVGWLLVRRSEREQIFLELGNMVLPLRQQADFEVLRGVLAVEAGDVARAREHFRQALYAGTDADAPVLDFGGRPLAEGYLQLIERK